MSDHLNEYLVDGDAGEPTKTNALSELVARVDEKDMSGRLTINRRRGDGWRIDAVRVVGRHTDRFIGSGGGFPSIEDAAVYLTEKLGEVDDA